MGGSAAELRFACSERVGSGAEALHTAGVTTNLDAAVGQGRPRDLRLRVTLLGGLAAAGAGACWVVKAGAILATRTQPPLLFELAPLLMATAVFGLAWQLPPSATRTTSAAVGVGAAAAATPVLLAQLVPLPGFARGAAMAAANLLVLVGLAVVGVYLRRHLGRGLPLLLAVLTVPAVMAGGLLMMLLGERALELPILVLGVAWTLLGISMVRGRYRAA